MTSPKRGPQTSNGSKRPKASINVDKPESSSSNITNPFTKTLVDGLAKYIEDNTDEDGFFDDTEHDRVKDGYYEQD